MYLSYLLNAYSCGMTLSLPEFTSALSLSPYYYAISHIHYYVLNGNVLAKRFPSPSPYPVSVCPAEGGNGERIHFYKLLL